MNKTPFTKIHRVVRPIKKKVFTENLSCVCFDAAIGNFKAYTGEDCHGCAFDEVEMEEGCSFCGTIAPCCAGDVFECTDYGLGIGGKVVLGEDIIWVENEVSE